MMPTMYILMEYVDLAAMFARATGSPIGSRRMGNALAHANRQMALHWHRHMLPSHFNATQKKYRYQERKAPYKKIKKLLANSPKGVINYRGRIIRDRVVDGGRFDNVRGGVLKRKAMSGVTVFASRTRATVTMYVPRYAAIQKKDITKPSIRKELTTVSPDEAEQLRRVFRRTLVGILRLERDRILRRI